MSESRQPRTGGQLLVESILSHGGHTGFCVPGESYLAVLDALHEAGDAFRLITCRHEAGAANAAEAWGKLTGRPGLCFVTRGPGATHASVGVHTAFQDSTPMILFVGDVARSDRGREAFQEVDFDAMFAPLAKWAATIDSAARVPEFVARAFAVAMSGRPGPVVLALPEDMLTESAAVAVREPGHAAPPAPVPAAMDMLAQLLAKAERPLAVLGGPGWDGETCAQMAETLARWDLPAVTSFRAKDRLDNGHACYAGDMGIGIDPALGKRIERADLLIVLGARLGEMTTAGYTRPLAPLPGQTLVHVHPSADELNRVYRADLAIASAIGPFVAAFGALTPPSPAPWAPWRSEARSAYETWIRPVTPPGDVNPAAIMATLRQFTPDDPIVTNGAGNYAGWVHRFHLHRSYPSQLGPTSGAMGYGLPAAIAAKLRYPDRTVVCTAGDGCFMMIAQELATAVQYGLGIIVLVFDNGMYGTIRMHQERAYPAHVIGTALRNPDFAAMAESFGAHGAHVRTTAQFAPAFRAALGRTGPTVLHIHTDPEAITPATTLSAIRAAGAAAKA